MNDKEQKKIYRKIKSRNISIDHACEVGVYLPQTSNIIDFIKEGTRASLVEADPKTVSILEDYFKKYYVTIFPVAVWSSSGTVRLSRAAASTFISELKSSPAIVNDKYKVDIDNSFEVKCVVFSEIDKGDIDLLIVDIEGGEWHVINHLTSRPKVISVETHGKYYTNPFIKEITQWMSDNQYSLWFKDASDTVFMKNELGKSSLSDQLETSLSEAKIRWKKFKQVFKKK
ncbi:MAG: FkbM family methyltransferase [Cytophagales bacterium]|jgi:FkbM family methyltransferase|nr:FkbM family methyltransferase [Cytophagales bacterium]MCA6387235.1 FkbM family methyltransferase [Cytophagales bacterium]MCA6392627.1 FkbM family methyltransferase [Cytophagales bacterium]MCA6395787.1 FkbM family methyltransferase [Cytophagales bacterium]MCA6398727.1 FkbM family methyltransferase [Cytophagales bacterium]